MNILAIDTSSAACSVALYLDGEVTEKHKLLKNEHSQYLLKYIDELVSKCSLKLNQLDVIAVGNGPGSFTGLRLGIGAAQGISYGLNLPVISVSSLLAVAAQAKQDYLIVAVDARMDEVYWQCFERVAELEFNPITEATLNKPTELALPKIEGSWHGIGSGWDEYSEQLNNYLDRPANWTSGVLPRAAFIAKFVRLEMETKGINLAEHVLPVYIRNKVTG